MLWKSFGEVVQCQAARAPDKPALIYPGKTLTWSELQTLSDNRAAQFKALGVRPDDLVAIALPNSVCHHEVSLAVWKLGATPCVLSAHLPAPELRKLIDLAQPRLLVRSGGKPVGVREVDPSSVAPPSGNARSEYLAPRNWKVLASGGSTGQPKLIVSHGPARLTDEIRGNVERLRIPMGGVLLNPGPLYHNGPFLFASLALVSGTTVVGMERFDAEECLRLIELYRVEIVNLVPTMMHRIWTLPAETRDHYDLSSLKVVWHFGAACPPWLKKSWIEWLGSDRIFELYSGTECPGTVITGAEWLRKPGSVGRVTPGSLYVLRPDGAECGVYETGELYFAAVAKDRFHYVGQEVKLSSDGRISIGDLGHIDEDGYLFLSDRRTDLIIRGGANIYPAEVEAVLEAFPSVSSAVVIGMPSAEFGQTVHAIIELNEGAAIDLGEIDSFVRSRISAYKCPGTYEIVVGPLRNEAGKVRRAELRMEREEWLRLERPFRTAVERPPVPVCS